MSQAIQTLKDNKGNLQAVAEEHPEVFVRHGRGLRDYVTTAGLVPPRKEKTWCSVYVGPPGVGKTRAVAQNIGEAASYWKPRGPWWDGYSGQKYVVLDDFYGWIPFSELLRVLDRYPLRVPIKGAFVEFTSEVIYITSNKDPEEWYDKENIHGTLEALFRRINEMWTWDGQKMVKATPKYKINY